MTAPMLDRFALSLPPEGARARQGRPALGAN